MEILFKPGKIGSVKIKNRFVRSATWEGMAGEDGSCSEKIIELMVGLARGRVGLIITGHAFISLDGKAGPWQMGIHKDSFIEGLQKMTDMVHQNKGKIFMQLSHAGCFTSTKLTGEMPIAPSLEEGLTGIACREMTKKDISRVVEDFGKAALRAKRAGFDGVQIHAAHGYLLSQFLSPVFNRREDEYGGPLENRSRTIIEVLMSIKEAAGREFPVLIKMNCSDFFVGGLDLDDSVDVGEMLQKHGIDAIELSGGTPLSGRMGPIRKGILSMEKEAYFKEEARVFKKSLMCPLILVGGIRSYETAMGLVEEGYADYISMSRPFIREPDLIKRWESGDHRKASCISDNRCFSNAKSGKGLECVSN